MRSEIAAVLLVDDHPENLLALEAVLDHQGLDLVRANSGNDALRLSLKQDFALVLLDVQMPGMSGFETAELMRANPKTRHLPIIFVTAGMNDQQLLFKGYELGAVDYLIKPFEPKILQSKVKVFCELYRQRRKLESAHQEQLINTMREGYAHCKMIYEDAQPEDFVYIKVNMAFEALTGLKDVVGRKVSEVIPGIRESNPELFDIYGRVAATGNPELFETYLEPLGKWFSLSVYSTEKEHFVAVFQNITERKLVEQELQDRQARINGLIEAAMDAIVSTDENQNIIIFNYGAEQMFGYRAADIIGQPLDLLIPARFRGSHRKHVDEFGKTGITTRTMNRPGQSYGLRANGEEFPFEATISRVNVAGSLIYTAILRDTTFRKQAETELRIAASAFESQEGMLITDANGVILRVNQAFTETTGYTSEEAVGQTPRMLKSGRHNTDFYRAMWETLNRTGKWQGEVWDRRKNGEIYPKWLTITAVKGDNGSVTHYVGSHVDITERKAAEDEVKNLAFYDPLTRLPNRRLLLDRLDHALASSARSGREGALLFIDLDNFKTLNDTLGHDIGDLLLQHVALRLSSCVREGDTVARLGGDEFVVMLEDLSKDSQEAAAQTETVGEKILTTLNQPYQLAAHEYHSTPSIGATLFTGRQLEVDILFKQADIAMYQSKKAGRNTLHFFDPQMQDTINARAALEDDLRKAIKLQQFCLYYQVQVDGLKNPVGAEALIRWHHPQRGLVNPVEFIPLAEETGLILQIGKWVLETACVQLAKWSKQGEMSHLSLSVNVSAYQFQQDDFADQVLEVLEDTGANPERLKLELTESMLVSNLEGIIAKMSALNARGVGFSLDDFGMGYSSLSNLIRLPLVEIKIDKSFVMEIESNDDAVVICIATISLAHSLKLKVVAEGVETEAQSYILGSVHHCDYLQGYLFGKPLPIEEFEAWLKKG